jgi:hypothetical protein
MTRRQAEGWLKRFERHGYVAYHQGICRMETSGSRPYYGINVDGDGGPGRPFGCPRIIWDQEHAAEILRERHNVHYEPYA